MLGFKALNVLVESDEYRDEQQQVGMGISQALGSETLSVEAKEAMNLKLHEQALLFLRSNDYLQAQQRFHELLNSPLLVNITPSSKASVLSSPMAMLKYSALKNMANLYDTALGKKDMALKMYIEAIDLDGREVSVWYNIGRLAMSLAKWNVARVALERAISQSAARQVHWPSLEKLIELLYVIGDHAACESVIQQRILLVEPAHLKGNIIRLLIERERLSLYAQGEEDQRKQLANTENLKRILSSEQIRSYTQVLLGQYEKLKTPDGVADAMGTDVEMAVASECLYSGPMELNRLLKFLKNLYNERSKSVGLYKAVAIDCRESQEDTQTPEKGDAERTFDEMMVDVTSPQNGPMSPPPTTSLNSSSNSITSPLVNVPTTRARRGQGPPPSVPTPTSSRAKSSKATAASPSPSDEDQEIEQYFDALVNENRPISQSVIEQFQTSSQSKEDGAEKGPKSTSSSHNATVGEGSNDRTLVQAFFKRQSTDERPRNILDWIVDLLNYITIHCSHSLSKASILNIFKLSNLVREHSTQHYHPYFLLLSELLFDKYLSAIKKQPTANCLRPANKEGEVDLLDYSELSYYIQQITLNLSKYPSVQGLVFKIRFKWLLSGYTRRYLGDINLATVYLTETEELFKEHLRAIGNENPQASKSIVLGYCSNDRVINSIILEEIISTLQDQQQKNTVGELFNRKQFDQVIGLLEPIFPDSLVVLEQQTTILSPNGTTRSGLGSPNSSLPPNSQVIIDYTFEFKSPSSSMDSQTKSRLNMIDLLLQSYLNISNDFGVLKMTIILLKEISPFINNTDSIQQYILLVEKIFETLKPKDHLSETLSTLLSILVRIISKYYKRLVTSQLFELFLTIYQFDSSKKLNQSQLLSLYFILHHDLGKKKSCASELPFIFKFKKLLFNFLICTDHQANEAFDVGKYIEPKEEMLLANVMSDISQCFYCIYGVRLMSSVDDHSCKHTKPITPSKIEYLEMYILMKLLNSMRDDIKVLPLNPRMDNESNLEVVSQLASKRELKDLLEQIYTQFKEPPESISRYKAAIKNYFKGILSELPMDNYESPIQFEEPLAYYFDRSNGLLPGVEDPSPHKESLIYSDIYKDIYYYYPATNPPTDISLKKEMLMKDLYCNPNRLETWTMLCKTYDEEYSNLTSTTGIMVSSEHPEIEQKIDILFQRLKLVYKHLTRLEETEDEHLKTLAHLCYERHYFIDPSSKSYKSQCEKLYYETLVYLESAIRMNPEYWYYYYLKSKVEKKLGKSPKLYLETCLKSIQSLPPATTVALKKSQPVYPLYRLHTDRLKLLISPSDQFPLTPENLQYLEKFNFQKQEKEKPQESVSVTEGSDPVDVDAEPKTEAPTSDIESTAATTTTTSSSIDSLISNSNDALQYCRQLLYYHHQSAYRISWVMRMNKRDPDASLNALNELIKLMKPKLSRLSKACVWSLWNEDYIGDGKLDRYFIKYYHYFIQLLTENLDVKNLEIVYFKIKNDPKVSKLFSTCYQSLVKVLTVLANQKFEQHSHLVRQSQLKSIQSNEGNLETTEKENEDLQQKIQQQQIEIDSLLKFIWDLYNDLYLNQDHKPLITTLMTDTFKFLGVNPSSPKKNLSWDDVLSFFEKKFSKFDKRKKKPLEEASIENTPVNTSPLHNHPSNLIIGLNTPDQKPPSKKLKFDEN